MTAAAAPLILVATPDVESATALQERLGAAWTVDWIATGPELLTRITDETPRLLLIAADLPGLTGLQVTNILKAEPEFRTLPMVVLHRRGYRMDELLGSEVEADAHLTLHTPAALGEAAVLRTLHPFLERAQLPPLKAERVAELQERFQANVLLPRLATELRDTVIERAILRALATASTKLEDLPGLLKELLLLCGDVLEFNRAGLYLYEQKTLYTLHNIDQTADSPDFVTQMMEQAEIFAGMVDLGPPATCSLGSFLGPTMRSDQNAVSFFAVPLMGEKEPLGILGVNTLKAFSQRDYFLRTLGLLSQQIALALGSALLYDRVQKLSRTDELTGLVNRRAFFERAQEEALRHVRFRSPLTVLMTDIDWFKQFNDTYGHQQGDWVLKEVAQIFRDNLRSIDIPGRMGGEEYIVLLPETGTEGGLIVAERLRQAVEAHLFVPVEGTEPLRCTVSIGVATYDGTGRFVLDELIAAADTAMYAAKNGGRNRVMSGAFGLASAT